MDAKTRLYKRLKDKEHQLAIAQETYARLLALETENYRFDSGEGWQQEKFISPSIIKNQITELESEIENLYRILANKGIIVFDVRRYDA